MTPEVDSKNKPDEISVKEFLYKVRFYNQYLKSKWLTILLVGVIAAGLGVLYAVMKKPMYTASYTFVLEDGSKGGGLSQYAGLASLAGIDLSGGGSSGIFQGDNILELYKSRTMIEKALLSESVFDGKKQLLINRYIEFNGLQSRWQKDEKIGNISFDANNKKFNRLQDSIISSFVIIFNKKMLSVTKPDKKMAIIKVDVSDTDEQFARNFNLKLVETVNNFYFQTKTKKSSQSISTLKQQADSVRRILDNSIYGVASAIDATPNPNPALQILRTRSQRKQVDVQASTAIYSEIVKNLELSKMALRQEAPLIQTIDTPVFPLPVAKTGKAAAGLLGFFIGGFLTAIILVIKKLLNSLLK